MIQPSRPSIHNVEWAIHNFRPLLKDLQIQHIGTEPTYKKAADYRNLIVNGMSRCIITVQRQHISEGQKGYFVLIHQPELDLFILSIVIDENLFTSDDFSLRVERKALGIHEFVHCVAAMLSLSLLGKGPNLLVENLKLILKQKVTVTTSSDFNKLFQALGTIAKTEDNPSVTLFNDTHFRTGYEDFPDDYAELYLNFLFSYTLLLEVITKDKLREFKNLLKETNTNKLVVLITNLVNDIVEKKALKRELVIQRLSSFLPTLAVDVLQIK